ncbi:hypothetical protein C8R42DRAFT_717840 [Lentinula raphanica]|nr:hypothetical protein C8R42DRAFT_717840 [Lentinula raphanica]
MVVVSDIRLVTSTVTRFPSESSVVGGEVDPSGMRIRLGQFEFGFGECPRWSHRRIPCRGVIAVKVGMINVNNKQRQPPRIHITHKKLVLLDLCPCYDGAPGPVDRGEFFDSRRREVVIIFRGFEFRALRISRGYRVFGITLLLLLIPLNSSPFLAFPLPLSLPRSFSSKTCHMIILPPSTTTPPPPICLVRYTRLVLAKLHRIGVYSIKSGGVEYMSAVEVRGKVRLVRVVRGGAAAEGREGAAGGGENDEDEYEKDKKRDEEEGGGGRRVERVGGEDTQVEFDKILVLLDNPDVEILVLGDIGNQNQNGNISNRIGILKPIPIQECGRHPEEFCMDLQVVWGTKITTGSTAAVAAICIAYAGVLPVVWIESGEVESVQVEGMMNLIGVGVSGAQGAEKDKRQIWMIHLRDRKERLEMVVKILVVPVGSDWEEGGVELLDGDGDGDGGGELDVEDIERDNDPI